MTASSLYYEQVATPASGEAEVYGAGTGHVRPAPGQLGRSRQGVQRSWTGRLRMARPNRATRPIAEAAKSVRMIVIFEEVIPGNPTWTCNSGWIAGGRCNPHTNQCLGTLPGVSGAFQPPIPGGKVAAPVPCQGRVGTLVHAYPPGICLPHGRVHSPPRSTGNSRRGCTGSLIQNGRTF